VRSAVRSPAQLRFLRTRAISSTNSSGSGSAMPRAFAARRTRPWGLVAAGRGSKGKPAPTEIKAGKAFRSGPGATRTRDLLLRSRPSPATASAHQRNTLGKQVPHRQLAPASAGSIVTGNVTAPAMAAGGGRRFGALRKCAPYCIPPGRSGGWPGKTEGPGKSPAPLASPAGAGACPAAAPGITAAGRTAAGRIFLHGGPPAGPEPRPPNIRPRLL